MEGDGNTDGSELLVRALVTDSKRQIGTAAVRGRRQGPTPAELDLAGARKGHVSSGV